MANEVQDQYLNPDIVTEQELITRPFVQCKQARYTFTQEYLDLDTLDFSAILGLPANARIVSTLFRGAPSVDGYDWYYGGGFNTVCSVKAGTLANPEAFSNDNGLNNPLTPGLNANANTPMMIWHKEAIATYPVFTFVGDTTGLTGKELQMYVYYIQE